MTETMEIVYNDNTIKILWTILRSTSQNKEDFTRAKVFAFAVSCTNVIPLNIVSQECGVLTIQVPSGLTPDIYAVKALWWKEGAGHHPVHPFYDQGRHGGRIPDIHGGSAGVCMAYKDELFALTDIQSEATNPSTSPVFSLTSHVETYGYDGLSAYELAVLRGKTTLTESEWLDNNSSSLTNKVNNLIEIVKKYHPEEFITNNPLISATIEGLDTSYDEDTDITITKITAELGGNVKTGSASLKMRNTTTGEETTLATGFTLTASTTLTPIEFTVKAGNVYKFYISYQNENGDSFNYLVQTVDNSVTVTYNTPVVSIAYSKSSIDCDGETITPTLFQYTQTRTIKSAKSETTETATGDATTVWKLVTKVDGSWQETTVDGVKINASTGALTFGLNAKSERQVNVMCVVTMNGVSGNAVVEGITQSVNTSTTVTYYAPTISNFSYSKTTGISNAGETISLNAPFSAYQRIRTTKADGTYTDSTISARSWFTIKESVDWARVDDDGNVTFDANTNTGRTRSVTIVAHASVSTVTPPETITEVTKEITMEQNAASAVYNLYAGTKNTYPVSTVWSADDVEDNESTVHKTFGDSDFGASGYIYSTGDDEVRCKWIAIDPSLTVTKVTDDNNVTITDEFKNPKTYINKLGVIMTVYYIVTPPSGTIYKFYINKK